MTVKYSDCMDLNDAETLAHELLGLHNLTAQGWTFTFDNAKRRFGICRFRRREIGLSAPLAKLNSYDDVRDTILHEIAHALAGPNHGHDNVWRTIALQIGARGERCADGDTITLPPKWTGSCPCGFTVGRERLTKATKAGGACPNCCDKYNGGKFSDAYLLVWQETVRIAAA